MKVSDPIARTSVNGAWSWAITAETGPRLPLQDEVRTEDEVAAVEVVTTDADRVAECNESRKSKSPMIICACVVVLCEFGVTQRIYEQLDNYPPNCLGAVIPNFTKSWYIWSAHGIV